MEPEEDDVPMGDADRPKKPFRSEGGDVNVVPLGRQIPELSERAVEYKARTTRAPKKGRSGVLDSYVAALEANPMMANPYGKMTREWRYHNLAKARMSRTNPSLRRTKGWAKPKKRVTGRGGLSTATRTIRSYSATTKKGKTVRMRVSKGAKQALARLSTDRSTIQKAAMVAAKSAQASKRATVLDRDVAVASACLSGM